MSKNLPRIACFHGGGSTAAIYETQCSFLTQFLKRDFQFDFFEGPFVRPPGPGVLPVFAHQGPYKTWFSNDGRGLELADGSGYDQVGHDGVERIWRMMESRQKEQGGEYVGVMGFSQGTRVAGGLLLDQQRRYDLKLPAASSVRLNFGVICMGNGAPMEAEVGHSTFYLFSLSYCWHDWDSAHDCDAEEEMDNPDTIIRIPTLHLHGLKDEFLLHGQHQYSTHYDCKTAKLLEIDYGHAMPWVEHESMELARRILSLSNGM